MEKPTVEQVQEFLKDVEPSVGGYGSEFEFEEHPEGVSVTFLAEWLPRHLKPVFVVTAVSDDTFCYHQEGSKKFNTETTEEFCNTCEEWSC